MTDTDTSTADTPYDRPDPSEPEPAAKPAKKAPAKATKKAAPKPAPEPEPEEEEDPGELTLEGVHEVLSGLERLVEHLISRVRLKAEGGTVDAETDMLLARVTNGMAAIGRVPEE